MVLKRPLQRESERGGALVEFAIVLPLLALLALGTVDVGRVFATWNEVKNAAREGAAYAQLYPGRQVNAGDCADPANIRWQARKEAGGTGSSLDVSVSPAVTTCNGTGTPASGSDITVTVSKQFAVVTPLVGSVFSIDKIQASVTVRAQ